MVKKQSNWHPAFSIQPRTAFLQKIDCFQTKLLSKPVTTALLRALKNFCMHSSLLMHLDGNPILSMIKTELEANQVSKLCFECNTKAPGKNPPECKPARSKAGFITLYTSPSTAEMMSFDIKTGKHHDSEHVKCHQSYQYSVSYVTVSLHYGLVARRWVNDQA